jgi:hypothetical protein
VSTSKGGRPPIGGRPVTVILAGSQAEAIEELARISGQSKASVLRAAIAAGLACPCGAGVLGWP